MLDKSKIILIPVILAISVAFLSITWVSFFQPSAKKVKPAPIQSTPVQSIKPQPSASTKPVIDYQSDKLLEIVKTRPALSEGDSEIRNILIASLNNQSGILNQTNTYIIEYVKSPNVFQIEILVTDIGVVKIQAVDWLESKGLSFEGICKLPVMFYLSRDVANKLREQDIKFNPLPEGCQ